jgi:hypothetical protein
MKSPDWLTPNDYPDDRDIDAFGDDSPWDNDPLTIGYVRKRKNRFWTPRRIGIAIVALILLATIVVPLVWPLISAVLRIFT